jgi:hypothetical protein
VAAQIALRIDALNGEPGQILHNLFSPSGVMRLRNTQQNAFPTEAQRWRELWLGRPVVSRENATRYRGAIATRWKTLPPPACRRDLAHRAISHAAAIFPRRRRNLM